MLEELPNEVQLNLFIYFCNAEDKIVIIIIFYVNIWFHKYMQVKMSYMLIRLNYYTLLFFMF